MNLICALTLTLVGVAAILYMFLFAHGFRGMFVIAAGMAIALGGYWLWEDFIKPDSKAER